MTNFLALSYKCWVADFDTRHKGETKMCTYMNSKPASALKKYYYFYYYLKDHLQRTCIGLEWDNGIWKPKLKPEPKPEYGYGQ